MNAYSVVNYHITNHCNYRCTYCFGKFDGQKDPSLDKAKIIIDNVAYYFKVNRIPHGRINFAGGEPMLYPHLDDLINYARLLGISVSIVTNGSLLTPERIRSWKGLVSCIGISIDSHCEDINKQIGRCCQGSMQTIDDWIALATAIHECGIALKINTVVSKLNMKENLLPFYDAITPQKIKLLQMHLISGINDRAKSYEITKQEFDDFCRRHNSAPSIIVAEPCGSMVNSYLMINPDGNVQLNNNGIYECYGNCCDTPLYEILKSVPIDADKFNSRYVREVNP